MKKVMIGLTGISFGKAFWGFVPEEYRKRAAQMKELAGKLDAELVAVPDTFQDAEGAAKAAVVMNGADVAVLDVATYPEGKAAMTFFDELKVPLTLWSRDESVHGTHIGHNSFCGANFLAGNLGLRGTRYRVLHGELSDPQVVARLRTAVRLIGAAKAAAGTKIGLFGEGIVPKFYDLDINVKDRATLAARYGIQFIGVPIKDLVDRATGYDAATAAHDAKAFAKRFALVAVGNEALDKQARILAALRDLSAEGKFASVAIRCWPELQSMYGAWPCPSLSALNDIGIPAACEGDPGGALDMLLASKLTKTPSTLMDVVDWDDKSDTFAIWHCGPTACSWADKGSAKLIPHNVDGRAPDGKPAAGLPAVVDMDFAPGKVTVYRTLGALDDEFVIQGEIIRRPKRHICGSFGTVAKSTIYGRLVSAATIRETILTRSLPHHYTAARGHLFA